MASVYGPLEAKIQKELSDRMYIELNYKPKTGMPGEKHITKHSSVSCWVLCDSGVAERGKEKLIKTTCNHIVLTNLHPRTAICITVQEMQDGGTVRKFIIVALMNCDLVHLFTPPKLVIGSINQCCVPCLAGFRSTFTVSCGCCDLSSK